MSHWNRIVVLLLGLLLVAGSSDALAARVLYIAPNGSDSNDGLNPDSALATLQRAQQLVDLTAHGDHTIYVRGGTYRGQSVWWGKHSSDHSITLAAYEDEAPIFDGILHGQMQPYFIHLGAGRNQCTNFTIRGLTIRHYLHWAVLLGDASGGASTWSGCNLVEDNIFQRNGDLYLPPPYECSNSQRGYGAIILENSGDNVIRNNLIMNSENCAGAEAFMHAVYLQHGSSRNEVHGNYISMTSGDTLRVRNGSNDNHFRNNHAARSGAYGFVAGWRNTEIDERPSSGNLVEHNVVVLPYPAFRSIALICRNRKGVCDESTYIDRGQKYFRGGRGFGRWWRR
jgi:hypothetical protein